MFCRGSGTTTSSLRCLPQIRKTSQPFGESNFTNFFSLPDSITLRTFWVFFFVNILMVIAKHVNASSETADLTIQISNVPNAFFGHLDKVKIKMTEFETFKNMFSLTAFCCASKEKMFYALIERCIPFTKSSTWWHNHSFKLLPVPYFHCEVNTLTEMVIQQTRMRIESQIKLLDD